MDYIQEDLSESKRKSRNLSEKKRRDAFNNLVTELAVLVTGVERRLDKSNVLKQAITFLRRHNQLQSECVSTGIVDQTRPSFLTADEYFRLLLDSIKAFVFEVEIGDDGDSAVIGYVSKNAGRFGSDSITEHLLNKSLYDVLDPENESVVREAFRSKANESSSTQGSVKLETASSTAFLRFTLALEIGGYARKDETVCEKAQFTAIGRLKTLSDPSSLVCICLARQISQTLSSSDLVPVGRSFTTAVNVEFSTRLDVEWRFLLVDSSVTYVLGFEPIELLGTSCYDYCHPDDLDKLAESHEQLKTQTDGITPPFRFRTKSAKYIWIRMRFYVTYHEWNSKPEFIVCTFFFLKGPSQILEDANGDGKTNGKSLAMNRLNWRNQNSVKDTSVGPISHEVPQQQNRQIFRPQPGVSIEHTPISTTTLTARKPAAKRPKTTSVGTVRDETAQPTNQMNEKMLWELLEKRQSNLQEKILQHQQELKRLQEQLFNAVPLLSSSSPASSNGTNEFDVTSPASSGLSPAGGPPRWPQQQPSEQLFVNQIWTPKYFDNGNGNGNGFSM